MTSSGSGLMREQIEGSLAIARTVARCRPHVVPAYPITPQTHIVEAVGRMVRDGTLTNCEYLTVESEFAAMSAVIGAAAAGARAYTATSSQGLLYMAEALFNAAGLAMPVVMTVANRAIGAPINIWNDHSDSMSQRDAGWVQLYAADNQDALSMHVVAFRLAETLSVPVMVCVDGFVLTHAVEPLDVPSQSVIDAFLPAFAARQSLDPEAPMTIGTMVGPDAYTEVRWLAERRMQRAPATFARLSADLAERSGSHVPLLRYHGAPHAKTVLVTLGSAFGTVQDALGESQSEFGAVSLSMFRPFPAAALRAAVAHADRVIVVERAIAPGSGGVVTPDVVRALQGTDIQVTTAVVGLGGRPVTTDAVREVLARTPSSDADLLDCFIDLRRDLVAAQEEGEP
jgi:pyruvate ferredoxin oxidoreductase alpha subunit